jgi:hypothetical protein
MSEPESHLPDLLPTELKGFEASLAALAPLPPTLDRDRLMFEAGRASRPPARLPWSIACASTAACCALLLATWASRPGPLPQPSPLAQSEGVSNLPAEDEPATALQRLEPDSHLQLRRHLAEVELATAEFERREPTVPADDDRRTLFQELLN